MKNFKPILFSSEMVQAILEGRKTQTRRNLRININHNAFVCAGILTVNRFWNSEVEESPNPLKTYASFIDKKGEEMKVFSKYQEGDILWVRETCKVGAWDDREAKVAFDYKASPELKKTPWVQYQELGRFDELHLKVLDQLDAKGIEPFVKPEKERFYYKWEPGKSPLNWTPSIFMPKEACRIFLEVTSVRVERLRDISEEDGKAEGVIPSSGVPVDKPYWYAFMLVWRKIHSLESWQANPWVWVYEFKRIEKPENF